jgi:hypothetical protein
VVASLALGLPPRSSVDPASLRSRLAALPIAGNMLGSPSGPSPGMTCRTSNPPRDSQTCAQMIGTQMTFPPFTPEDALRLASLDESAYAVDHFSIHRDLALARVVKLGSSIGDVDGEVIVCARCDRDVWKQVDTFDGCETVDCRFGGGAPWMAGRELTYRIPDVVMFKTVVSPHGNWSFVYSDPLGRRVVGTSVVEGDWRPPERHQPGR